MAVSLLLPLDGGLHRVLRSDTGREGEGVGFGVNAGVGAVKSTDTDVGWELPPTQEGAWLIRWLTPSKWWGRSDTIALDKTLNPAN